jgi:hypothetical protein
VHPDTRTLVTFVSQRRQSVGGRFVQRAQAGSGRGLR